MTWSTNAFFHFWGLIHGPCPLILGTEWTHTFHKPFTCVCFLTALPYCFFIQRVPLLLPPGMDKCFILIPWTQMLTCPYIPSIGATLKICLSLAIYEIWLHFLPPCLQQNRKQRPTDGLALVWKTRIKSERSGSNSQPRTHILPSLANMFLWQDRK